MKSVSNCLAMTPEDNEMTTTKIVPDGFDAAGLDLIKRLMDVRGNDMGTSSGPDPNSPYRRISSDNIRRARFHLDAMNAAMQQNNLMAYNRSLLMLLSSLPRPVKGPVTATADTMAERLTWEAAFTDAVEQALNRALGKAAENKQDFSEYARETNWLRKNNMNIHLASAKDVTFIKSRMQGDAAKFIRAWAVDSKDRDDEFERYVKEYSITKTDMLWHGSPTVNFISILENGLSLQKASYGMFGKGLYFAPEFDKSRGYCSVSGARWRGGTDNSAFLAVVEVATGNSLHTSTNSGHSSRDSLPNGYDSLWAHAGSGLCRDEVIVYDQRAVRIKYIVETR